MAITQISRITHRTGLEINLPQLAGAELGWSIDARKLFIGNGTLTDGAPVIGNTEILTEFSDILAVENAYVYKGEAAGYTVQTGPAIGAEVSQTLQSWLDNFAVVTDFGAVGDGVTDDTAAINRALYQLYCREVNPQIRRALFFPAGVYKVQETIIIPTYATLYGEGANNSVILMNATADGSSLNAYVARTGDSLQQTGTNIGNNGATAPEYITCTNMGFQSADTTPNIFLVDRATNCRFQNVMFAGPFTTADLTTDADDVAGVRFDSAAGLICNEIIFDGCEFTGTTYGVNTDEQVRGITVENSKLHILYSGVVLGDGTPILGGPTGVRIMHNMFDSVYAQGILLGEISLNATGYNIFYDVGNEFGGVTAPAFPIIEFEDDNNISIGDMFERADAFATTYRRIELNDKSSIGITNGSEIALGTYVRESGKIFALADNVSNQTIFTVDATLIRAFNIVYTITRNYDYRTGTLLVVSDIGDSSAGLISTDDFVENNPTGITLLVSQSGDVISIKYTSTSTGVAGSLTYSVSHQA